MRQDSRKDAKAQREIAGPEQGWIVITREQRPRWLGYGDSGALRFSSVHLRRNCQFLQNRAGHASIVPIELGKLAEDPMFEDLGVCQACADPVGLAMKKRRRQAA